MVRCDCGEDHRVPPAVATLIRELGTHIRVTVGDRSWRVPRVWIAAHGLKGWELPDLAARHGWEEELTQSETAIP